MTSVATERYVTADFQSTPLIALADLMGLKHYQNQIAATPELYTPILNGIAVYRHLPGPQRQEVNRLIQQEVPRGSLTVRLMDLVTDLSVQHFWYMWSLSDEELLEFFHFSRNKAEITDQMNPVSVPDLTVPTIASGVILLSQEGPRAFARKQLGALKESELVKEVAKRLGFQNRMVSSLGVLSIPSIIVISGLNIMAKKEANKARKELAARGLLVYSDL